MKLFLTLCLLAGIIVSVKAQINLAHRTFEKTREQYGSIPYAFVTSSAFTEVISLRLRFQYYFGITENMLIQPVFMYEYEEEFPSMYRNRFNSQIITFFRFI